MTNDDGRDWNDGREWSCNTCTFINQPLFLACDMCGTARPCQGPTPPRRQPSFEPEMDPADDDVDDFNDFHISSVTATSNTSGVDRAPRRVQRHRSTSPIFGTLIMTDDPANYESQDGKKHGEAEDDEEELSRRLQDDPSLDDDSRSEDAALEVSLNHHQVFEEPHRHRDTHIRQPTRSVSLDSEPSEDERFDRFRPLPASPVSVGRQQHHHHQRLHSSTSSLPAGRDYSRRPSAPSAPSVHKYGHSSNSTLPTNLMGSSSSRLAFDMDGSHDEDSSYRSSMSSSRASASRMSQSMPQQHYHYQRMGSRRSLNAGYAHGGRQQPQPAVQWQTRRSDGLPIVMPRETATRRGSSASYATLGSSNRRLMADHSAPCYVGESRRSLAPQQQRASLQRNAQMPSLRNMRQGSLRSSNTSSDASGGDFIESVLPSIAPPPVPVMDSPAQVDVMAVCQKDIQVAQQRRQSTMSEVQQATVRGRKLARAAMLDSVSRSTAFNSNRSLATNNTTGGNSSISSRNYSGSGDSVASPFAASASNPGQLMLDSAALDAPSTRRGGRRKDESKNRLKNGIRGVMAAMRISAKN